METKQRCNKKTVKLLLKFIKSHKKNHVMAE